MPNIFKRLKNLWSLSGMEISHLNSGALSTTEADKFELVRIKEKPAMAKIIRMRDPAKEVLKNEQI